jgi:hypothetical protein
MVAGCFDVIERMVDGVNAYALVYIAYAGVDFTSAVKHCNYLFRRNLIASLITGTPPINVLLFRYRDKDDCVVGNLRVVVDGVHFNVQLFPCRFVFAIRLVHFIGRSHDSFLYDSILCVRRNASH